MPLNQAQLITRIIAIQDEMVQAEDYEATKEIYAARLTAAFYEFLMSGTLVITGTSSAGPITGTATFEG
ncbi:hypothetical protein [Faecalibacter macacae]|uniref:Uncharacterized protein n=1 Tax=Faecalibacter macacae TaxID=1859289 RepID=A0A3L9MBG3_9FLAO|nr:hypothetical protein [Faecalibacter macacae]RLZ08604.1 hypothetical protein EAH69_09835 [Faecalibacter macacae]